MLRVILAVASLFLSLQAIAEPGTNPAPFKPTKQCMKEDKRTVAECFAAHISFSIIMCDLQETAARLQPSETAISDLGKCQSKATSIAKEHYRALQDQLGKRKPAAIAAAKKVLVAHSAYMGSGVSKTALKGEIEKGLAEFDLEVE